MTVCIVGALALYVSTSPPAMIQDKASSSSLLHLFVAGSRSDGQEKVQPN